MITLLAASALRSLLLGLFVWAALKLFRLRDTGSETLIWTLVLAACLAMPFAMRALPGGIALPAWHAAPAALSVASAVDVAAAPTWLQVHGAALLWSLYAGIATVGLLRLLAGLVLCLKLYRNAAPVTDAWAQGNHVRMSAKIDAPLSIGSVILVPADCREWPAAKRLAVLAHEEAHIRRGDFFIQLLAGLHRAIFWFNPFAWWLQAHLRDLAETASDDAAIQELNDAAGYAEILVEVSARTQRSGAALTMTLAMARGPGIAKRVDHILSGVPEHAVGRGARLVAVLAVLAAAGTIAGAHAREVPAANALPIMRSADTAPPALFAAAAAPQAQAPLPARPAGPPAAAASRTHRTAQAAPVSPITYNPRALLEAPGVVVLPAFVPLTNGN